VRKDTCGKRILNQKDPLDPQLNRSSRSSIKQILKNLNHTDPQDLDIKKFMLEKSLIKMVILSEVLEENDSME
jgi:hypothetical protein